MSSVFKAIRRHRFAAALALAVFYAFCILAPHAAVALGGDPHCLTDMPVAAHVHGAKAETAPHSHSGTVHQHGDGTTHSHSGDGLPQHSDGHDKSSGACCGLFCITAIALDVAVILPAPPPVSLAALGLDEVHTGRGPTRINRPPIA